MDKKFNRNPKTLERWEELLLPLEVEALHDYNHNDPWEPLTPNEVLDTIVSWNGGIATAYEVKSLINRVYGVEL